MFSVHIALMEVLSAKDEKDDSHTIYIFSITVIKFYFIVRQQILKATAV